MPRKDLIVKAKAPLRIGLAGGGTDLKNYIDLYTSQVINFTICKFAYAEIRYSEGETILESIDYGVIKKTSLIKSEIFPRELIIHKAIYDFIIKEFNNGKDLPIKLATYCEAPIGTGLGSSSTLTVAIIKAFDKFLNLGLDNYQLAELAYKIERIKCNLAGGKQDHYSSAFGGINHFTFNRNFTKTNKLKLESWFIAELEASMILHYTGQSRHSDKIIKEQSQGLQKEKNYNFKKMHLLSEESLKMKEYLLTSNFEGVVSSLKKSWEYKNSTSKLISNQLIEDTIKFAFDHGALAAKVSGAGGGGYMFFITSPSNCYSLKKALSTKGSETSFLKINNGGAFAWIKD